MDGSKDNYKGLPLSLKKADRLLQDGDYQQALESYFAIATACAEPGQDCRALMRDRMLNALAHTLDSISSSKDNDDWSYGLDWDALSTLAKRVYSLYGDDEIAMTMLGVKCLDEGLYEQAEFFLNAALLADRDSLAAKENLRVLFDRVVHRWHFHMLNDIQRNSGYFKAIHSAIQMLPHCTVLDIGSGTGILSMMAVRSGAEKVYALEVNSTMVAMSRKILDSNGMSGKVNLIHSLSTSLSVPRDIPQRANLVVTEIVDAGLLGEHIIPTLRHAWKELLLPPPPHLSNTPQAEGAGHVIPPSGHVIPERAVVYAMGIECQEIRKKSSLLSSTIAGVSVESVRLEGSCKNREGPQDDKMVSGVLEREPYSCERLSHIRGGFTALTLAQPVLCFDFTQPQIPLPENRCPLAVTQEGRLDAVAVWFDLHLFADVSLSTPPSWDLSWEQAIFPVVGIEGTGVEPGDVVLLHASCSDISLFMDVERVERATPTPPGANMESSPLFFVERSDLLRLNDCRYASSYQQALTSALSSVGVASSDSDSGRAESPVAECIVLDMCHGLSFFGIAAAKLGADFVQVSHSSPAYQPLIERLAVSNQVAGSVTFQHQDMRHCHSRLLWDIVLCDVASPQGTLREGIFEKLAHIRATQLCDSSLIIPSGMSIEAVLISSPTLRSQSSVLGSVPTLGFEIAPFINHYQVTHFVDLDLSAYPMQLLSSPVKLMEVDLNSLEKEPLKVTCEMPVDVLAEGCVTGIAYWFTFQLFGDIMFSTAPRSHQESHWHQSVFVLPEDVTVQRGNKVILHGLIRDSCIDISLTLDLPN